MNAPQQNWCSDCLSRCPWCGRRRWETRAYGCGSLIAGADVLGCRKSKRLKGVPCPKCGLASDSPFLTGKEGSGSA